MDKKIRIVYYVTDGITIGASSALAWYLHYTFLINYYIEIPSILFCSLLTCLIFIHLLLYKLYHLYDLKPASSGKTETLSICKANLMSICIMIFIKVLSRQNPYIFFISYTFFALFFAINICTAIIIRKCVHRLRFSV